MREREREVKNNKIKLQASEYDKGSCYVRTHIVDIKIS